MEILSRAKNGVVVEAVKSFNELTQKEKSAMVLIAGTSVEDYATFKITQNKKGEKLKVVGYESTKTNDRRLIDVVDQCTMVFGQGKQRQKAAERILRRVIK